MTAGAVAGAAAGGLLATAYAPSSSLRAIGAASALSTLASKRLPAVFHVTAHSVSAGLETANDLGAVYAAADGADGGVTVLASSTPQEAHDLALTSHVIALSTASPVVHVVDGAGIADVTAKVRLLRYHELAAAVEGEAKARRAEAAAGTVTKAPQSSFATVSGAFKRLGPLLGARYSAFSYAGSANPSAVIVATGANAASLTSLLSDATAAKVGVVTVRVLRPWEPSALLAALPSHAGLRTVTVVSPHDFAAGASGLYADVSAAFARRSAVIDCRVGGSGLLDAGSAVALLASAAAGCPVSVPAAAWSPSTLAAILSAASQAAKTNNTVSVSVSAVVYGLSHDGAQAATTAATSVLAAVWPGDVRGRASTGTVDVGVEGGKAAVGVTVTELAISNAAAGALAPAMLPTADVIVLSHPSLLTSLNALARLKQGGVVVLNTPLPKAGGEDKKGQSEQKEVGIEAILPLSDRQLLAQRGAALFTLCAAEVAAAAVAAAGPVVASSVPSGPGSVFEAMVLQAALTLALGKAAASGGGALTSALSFNALAPSMEAGHASALPPFAASSGLLQKVYAKARAALTKVKVPPSWAATPDGNSSRDPRPLHPRESLPPAAASAALSLAPAPLPPCVGPSVSLGPSAQSAETASASHDAAADASAAFLRAQSRRAALALAHKEAYATSTAVGGLAALAAESAEGGGGHGGHVYTGTVTVNRRLTPLDYDRNIFHVEIDIAGTGLEYHIGSALGVYAVNPEGDVRDFLAWYGLAPEAVAAVDAPAGDGAVTLLPLLRLFRHELDLFGRPDKQFYESLAAYASDPDEAATLRHIGSDAGTSAFKAREDEGVTFAEVLREFPSAKPPVQALLALLPRIKARHYSIASSQKVHPDSVHLLVVEVGWTTPGGKQRYGQASHYLAQAGPGTKLAISVLPSEMQLPADPASPIVMAGLGTGMAPFRAFLQERFHLAEAAGVAVGPMTLYFGSRFRSQEYLYGDELEAWAAAHPQLLRLRLAFSRDGPRKMYIQHLMKEDGAQLWAQLQAARPGGNFYLCGPTWPEPDVEEAVTSAFAAHGGMDAAAASALIKDMKAARRYVLEVY